MKVVYTRHAKGRMRWRGISKQEVENVALFPERTEHLSMQRFHYYRTVDERTIRVTLALEDEQCIIISAVVKDTL